MSIFSGSLEILDLQLQSDWLNQCNFETQILPLDNGFCTRKLMTANYCTPDDQKPNTSRVTVNRHKKVLGALPEFEMKSFPS